MVIALIENVAPLGVKKSTPYAVPAKKRAIGHDRSAFDRGAASALHLIHGESGMKGLSCNCSKEIAMKAFKQLLATTLLGATALLTWTDSAIAGRLGGAIAERITIPGNQSVVFDIPFAAGEPAVVTVEGAGMANLDVTMYDGDGNNAFGLGFRDRKTVSMRVYREGLFRIEVRNLSPMTSSFMLRTN